MYPTQPRFCKTCLLCVENKPITKASLLCFQVVLLLGDGETTAWSPVAVGRGRCGVMHFWGVCVGLAGLVPTAPSGSWAVAAGPVAPTKSVSTSTSPTCVSVSMASSEMTTISARVTL